MFETKARRLTVLMMVFGGITLCTCRPDEEHSHPPRLPDQFTFHMEAINDKGHQLASSRETFDYKAQFSRRDFVPTSNARWHRHYQKYGRRPLIVVDDYTTGHQYVIDKWNRNCTTSNISLHDRNAEFNGTNVVHMKHAFDFLQKRNFVYTDQVLIRNIPTERWQTTFNHSKMEFYFLHANWSSVSEESMNEVGHIPVAMNFTRYDNVTNEVSWYHMIHIYDFYGGHTEQSHIPIINCHQQFKRVQITIQASFEKNIYSFWAVQLAMTRTLAKACNVTTIRINGLEIMMASSEFDRTTMTVRKKAVEAYVQFQIVDATQAGNVQHFKAGITMGQAYDNLELAIKKGITGSLNLSDGNKMSFTVVKSSLNKFSSDTTREWASSDLSSGTVAGIVISVSLVTFVLGFLVSFWLRKKFPCDKGVPYEVTM